MSFRPCRCTFIPPQVLDNLARTGHEKARLSTLQSRQVRTVRQNVVSRIGIEALVGAETTDAGARRVYDCGHQWEVQVQLARDEGAPVSEDEAVNAAYDGAGIVRDYYMNVLNRHSIDNRSIDIILNVNYGVDYMNAFWDGTQMVFGDGDGVIFVDFTKSLDVIGHELTHGVIQYTANLEYMGQSGALNEHWADVFGSAIKQHALNQTAETADWLIGSDIMGPELRGEALRSMKAPGTAYDNPHMGKDPQPDHMDNYYSGFADNQGVHINSGIPNKAFYLVSMDQGTNNAALVWYAALQKLWPTARFNDAVTVLLSAAQRLTAENKVPSGMEESIRAAFESVGLPR